VKLLTKQNTTVDNGLKHQQNNQPKKRC